MSTSGRTYWWAKDAAWWRRERIVELGEEFGPAGPAVIDWLSCEAKAQNDGGRVKSGMRSVARGCFVDVPTVESVLSRSVPLGVLDDFEGARGRFTCRISGWSDDQSRGVEAVRKARQRANAPVNTEDRPVLVPPCPTLSRSVPECPPTGQDRTGVTTTPLTPQRGEHGTPDLPPLKPTSGRERDDKDYQVNLAVWVGEHFPGRRVSAVEGVISWVRRDGTQPTPAALREFVERAPQFAPALEAAA